MNNLSISSITLIMQLMITISLFIEWIYTKNSMTLQAAAGWMCASSYNAYIVFKLDKGVK